MMNNTKAPAPGTIVNPSDPRVEDVDHFARELRIRIAGLPYIAYGERAADGTWTYRIY